MKEINIDRKRSLDQICKLKPIVDITLGRETAVAIVVANGQRERQLQLWWLFGDDTLIRATASSLDW